MPSRLFLGFCAILLVAGAIVFLSMTSADNLGPFRLAFYVGLPLIAAAALALCQRFGSETRRMTALFVFAIGLGAYGAETYLTLTPLTNRTEPPQQSAPTTGTFGRTLLRPVPNGGLISAIALDGIERMPFGGIANSAIGNGEILDERGFRNPPGLWTRRPIDIAIIGDSFAYGADLSVTESIVGQIRRRIPATLNLGMGGNGPLMELGSLVEYLPGVRPGVVLWFYFEGNDLTKDLSIERGSPLLRRYLESGYRQGLADRQTDIDTALAGAVATARASAEIPVAAAPGPLVGHLRGIATFETLRTTLGLSAGFGAGNLDWMSRILSRARDEVRGWNGRLILVYLPGEARYRSPLARLDFGQHRDKVVDLARRLGLPVVDIDPAFRREADPRTLFAGHYNARGAAIAAQAILTALPN